MEASALHAPALPARPSSRPRALRLRSDDQLLLLFRNGSEEAFTALVDRYRVRLLAYARRMLGGSQHDAEDALQDVFIRAYGALRADERPVSVRAWLYRVAHNRCIDQIRRTPPAPEDVYAVSRVSTIADPADAAERREDLRTVVRDVAALPDTQRSALLLREMDGLSYNELAATLDLSLPAIKSLLVRARTSLAEAGEARATPCATIRLDLETAIDGGTRPDGRTRRHVRECDPCREYQHALRGAAATHEAGPLAFLSKLLGIGGSGTAAVGGAASTKVAALVCCGVVAVGAGTAYELPRQLSPHVPAVNVPRAAARERAISTFAVPTRLPATAATNGAGTPATGRAHEQATPVRHAASVARSVSVEPAVGAPTRAGGVSDAESREPTLSDPASTTSGGQTGTSSAPGTGLTPEGRTPTTPDVAPATGTGAGAGSAAGPGTGTDSGAGTGPGRTGAGSTTPGTNPPTTGLDASGRTPSTQAPAPAPSTSAGADATTPPTATTGRP